MKKILVLLLLVLTISCKDSPSERTATDNFATNLGLSELYKTDQADRQTPDIDWSVISVRDKQREARVYELLEADEVKTSDDYANAAMIFQHGGDTMASGMAVKMMRKAIELDATRNKWLLAAAIDRDLMRRDQPQIYGTQYTKMGADEPWQIHDLDTTVISDSERREYGVETLAEQKEKLRMMNKKKLSALLQSGDNIDDIIALVQNSDLDDSEYNLSESGINTFGYELIGSNKDEDALKIFKLNTELYPDGYNTHDSYGECLVKLGKLEEGIAAYRKSLELDPNNDNAKKVLEEIDEDWDRP